MRKFWFTFEGGFDLQGYGVILGCGVTAEDRQQALDAVAAVVFHGDPIPRVLSVIEDVELSALDQKHVIPNIGYPERAGVWFPAYNAFPKKGRDQHSVIRAGPA